MRPLHASEDKTATFMVHPHVRRTLKIDLADLDFEPRRRGNPVWYLFSAGVPTSEKSLHYECKSRLPHFTASRHVGVASSHRAMLAPAVTGAAISPVAVSSPVSAGSRVHQHLLLEKRRRMRRRRRWRRGESGIRDHIVPPLHRLLRLWASGRVQCQHLAAATTIAFATCGHSLRRYLLV